MNNKENYKKAMDQVHADENLKRKLWYKMKEKETKRESFSWRQLSTVCSICVVMLFVVAFYLKQDEIENIDKENTQPNTTAIVGQNQNSDLPKFESLEQLKKALKKGDSTRKGFNGIDIAQSVTDTTAKEEKNSETTISDYSKTNTQVEGVDEADIVKTDGNYIYYISNNKIYIIEANSLKVASKIENEKDNEQFYPRELYINGNNLIALGNKWTYTKTEKNDTEKRRFYSGVNTKNMAKAIVYDISNKKEPKELRQVELDGDYSNSRMIGNNIYFISQKSVYYYDGLKDDDILPLYRDTAMAVEEKKIECTDIVYFRNTENSTYMLVAGFDITNNEAASVETFFGANDTIYANQNNLYIAQTVYENGYFSSKCSSTLYKFNLENSKVQLQCKGEVKGNLNDQFSMDEHDGNLRIATTSESKGKSTNQVYILDKDLKQIGKLENLAKGEKIYSVRFIGKIGYVVTFKEIDPLFVIDLSDPTNPTVKGKLKIPGYSSYLHPYDETHIIGIGYNTKSNGSGGVRNSSMKMSMFDVSDLENPKEIFSTSIGGDYTYSEITSNHKALFYNKDKNLIGFPYTYNEDRGYKTKNGFVIYKIDLDKGFEKYGEIMKDNDYIESLKRIIYIDNTLYSLSNSKVISYNLKDLKKIDELKLK